jgi:hypothetical protein
MEETQSREASTPSSDFIPKDQLVSKIDSGLSVRIDLIELKDLKDMGTFMDKQDPMCIIQIGSAIYETERYDTTFINEIIKQLCFYL